MSKLIMDEVNCGPTTFVVANFRLPRYSLPLQRFALTSVLWCHNNIWRRHKSLFMGCRDAKNWA